MALFPSPRIRLHEVFERGKSATSTLTIYEDGAAVVPTAATFSLLDSAGNAVIDSAVASISGGGELSYLVLASAIPDTISFSDSYLIKWGATIAGDDYTFNRTCAIARTKLYPVISDLDLEQHYSDLANIRSSALSSYQGFITEAFILIIQRLRDEGNFEYLIISNQSLRGIHLDLTFYLIFKDMDSSGLGAGRYLELAQEHRRNFESGFKRLRLKYDSNSQGIADTDEKLRSAKALIFTSDPPYWGPRRW